MRRIEGLEACLVGCAVVFKKKVKKVVFCRWWSCCKSMPDRKLDWEEWELVRENFNRLPSKDQYLKIGKMVESCWREKYKTDVRQRRFFVVLGVEIFCFCKKNFFVSGVEIILGFLFSFSV